MDTQISSSSLLDPENIMEYTDLFNSDFLDNNVNDNITTLKSHSSCSSRTSHTESMNEFSEEANLVKNRDENGDDDDENED